MTYVSDVIKGNLHGGLTPVQVSGKEIVRLYICPECKKIKMVKFKKKGNGNLLKSQCRCGYVAYPPGWKY
jgi:hypothetical protein